MKRCLLLCSSNRQPERQTGSSIKQALAAGAALLEQEGTADVSMARNLALTAALGVLEQAPSYDVVLMIDDDMAFSVDAAQAVVSYAREHQVAASGAYILPPDARLAARHLAGDRWLTGLGFLAIPAAELRRLAAVSKRFKTHKDADVYTLEFTRSCADLEEGGELYWESEDFRLTRRLGGAVLLPVRVGHVKKAIMMPDATLEAFIEAERTKTP